MGDLDLRLTQADRDSLGLSQQPIGRILVDSGKIDGRDLKHALKLQARIDAPLGDIMMSEGLLRKQDVLAALARQAKVESVHLDKRVLSPELANRLPMDLCLTHGVVPLRPEADALVVAASRPRDFLRMRDELDAKFGHVYPVIADENQIRAAQGRLYGNELAARAEAQVAEDLSCRNLHMTASRRAWIGIVVLALLSLSVYVAPAWTVTFGVLLSALSLLLTTTLKAAAFLSSIFAKQTPEKPPTPFRMPRVSVLVPLLREREIAGQLINRLSQLTYPKSLLEVVLVLEEDDRLTRETIERTAIPEWMSVLEVPRSGDLTTKPRALNYALNFCKGSIIGVWDAEDWPEADQIEKVVTRFQDAPENVVCLQGILDYYNSRTNWLTRCFTIEYSTWWRIVIPGIARLGLVVPLGGTTLFFKRAALEELGGWDSHNVTEDADLGLRLARRGYVTELLPTTTYEEATSRGWSWVRQRSRWLKGFLITYLVHMRAPTKLLKELGLIRFMGIQTLFLASVVQFALTPLLWSFWLTFMGITHPVEMTLGTQVLWGLVVLFLAAEALNVIMGCVATRHRDRRHLVPFVPTMMVYFVLGTLAAYKAIWELIRVPFFWDKTQHGVSQITDSAPIRDTERV